MKSTPLPKHQEGEEGVVANAESRLSIGPLFVGFLIVSAAASPAVALWAANVAQVPKVYRLVLVASIFALIGAAVCWGLQRLLSDLRVAAFITFIVILMLSSGGQILTARPWVWRWTAAVVVVAIVVAIVLRLRDLWLLDAILATCSAALLLPALITGTWAAVAPADNPSPIMADEPLPTMAHRPDIVLVILDGYTGLPVIRELFGYEDPGLRGDLAAHGFDVVEPVFSAYSMTHLSVSSLLDLDYVTAESQSMMTEDGRGLGQVIGGDSALVRILSGNDYRITMVEPGWHMSTCGDHIDVCVSDSFIDEGVGAVLSQSLFWSFLQPSIGSAFTHGARHAMSWTLENAAEIAQNGLPDFLFVHVLAPHPPLFLDANCEVTADRRLGAINMGVIGLDPETARFRLDGYANQVQCVNGFVRELAKALSGQESLVFVSGDHGSDVMAQLSTIPDKWSDPQILERMSTFLAVKAPAACKTTSSLVTVSLFRSLVSCAGGLDLEPIGDMSFLVSQAEVDGRRADLRALRAVELRRLASCVADLDESFDCG